MRLDVEDTLRRCKNCGKVFDLLDCGELKDGEHFCSAECKAD